MKQKYIAPIIEATTIEEPLCGVVASPLGITQADSGDGPVVTDPTAEEGEAWGDVKQWNWTFED